METKTDILELAMDLEEESIELYENFFRQTIIKELSSIFQFLAGEEKSHYEILKAWRENTEAGEIEVIPFFPDRKKVFQKLSEHFNTYGIPATHYYNAYEKARIFEEKSLAFYEDLLENLENGKKVLLMKIIDQEKQHAEFFANMLEFLRHPGEWLENAEWHHLEEY